jgi:hypothetical protein
LVLFAVRLVLRPWSFVQCFVLARTTDYNELEAKRGGKQMSTDLRQLLQIIDQAYDHASWHGPSLRGSIRRVGAAEAGWRPGPQRHNIWEITVHAAYWKYAVWRRLTGAKSGSFELKGSNWFLRPAKNIGPGTSAAGLFDKAWRDDVALLDRMHVKLRAAIEALPAHALNRRVGRSKVTNFYVISGIAAHDVYHAGQIQLLKRLQND